MQPLGNFSGEKKRKLESYIADTMRTNHLYGLSLSLVQDGKPIYSNGFGSRSVDPPIAATADTLYGIGSSTKFFTALAILKLAEQGKISLTDPVEKHIDTLDLSSNGHPVTIHQLLSHSTGYPDLGMAQGVIGHLLGQQTIWTPLGGVDDLISLVNEASKERVSTKGDTFMYWNEGYILLGKIIEEASGQSYRDYITKNILEPLDMKRATFDRSKLESDENGMVGYYMGKDGRRTPLKFPSHSLIDAAGGLITSPNEMNHMVSMLIHGGLYQGNRMIKKELLDKAFAPHVQSNFAPSMGEGTFYGYGITVDKDFFGHVKLGHGGNVAVSSAYFGFIPDLKIGVSMAANSDFLTSPVGDYALALAMGEDPEMLPWIKFQRKVEALSGKYETYKGATKMQIAQKGFSLFADLGEEGETLSLPLLLEGDEIFAVEGPDKVKIGVEIRSPTDVDVRIDRMVFHKTGKL